MSAEGIISAIIIGAIIGAVARLVLPGRQNISIVLTIVVGIVAALLGTLLVGQLSDTKGVDWIELLAQIVLAVVGVALVSGATARRRL